MLGSRISAGLAVLSSFASVSEPAHADVSADVCSSSYAKGQEDRLAGRLFDAREAFEVCADPSCSASLSRDCKRWVTEVDADLPTVRVTVTDTRGVKLETFQAFADGTRIPDSELTQPVILESGPHVLRFEAVGYRPVELEKALRPSDRELEVRVILHALNEPLPGVTPTTDAAHQSDAMARGVPVLAVALASVGVVALGGSLYFGLRSHDQYESLKASCAPFCNPSQADSVRSKALISDVALLTSVAAFGGAAWLYFGSRSAQRPAAALNVEPSARGAGLRLRVAF
jgi:hypothetical protein